MLLSHKTGLIYCTIARTPDVYTGLLVALDKNTGNEVWRMDMHNYAWSSPVMFCGNDGSQYLAVADSMGYLFLLDAADGTVLQTLELGGLDAIAFTGGIGENYAPLRRTVLEAMAHMGMVIDAEANAHGAGERLISAPESAIEAHVIPANEELMVVQSAYEYINSK
jgi:hypothetical protein